MSVKVQTLAKYRKLLQLIKRLSEPQKGKEWEACRRTIRANVDAAESEAENLRAALDDKIRYLRIVTPKRPGDIDCINEASTRYVFRDGQLVQGQQARKERRVADGTMSMAEAHERHEKLLRRQHFGRKPLPYDPSTF
jgi:outer membrane protein TolC